MRRTILILAALLSGGQAWGASLRGLTTLHGPLVFLRDLFDDAGANADRVLGPGPAPGDRIVVEAAQLNAIARQFGVAWRSVSSADRAVLEWPGRALRQDEAMAAIRAAVTAAGAPEDIDVDLAGFSPPMVPAETEVSVTVSQLEYDSDSGRFSAALTVTGDNMSAVTTRISGRAEEAVEVPVTVTRLLPETVLRAEDVRLTRVRVSRVPADVAHDVDHIVGMQLRRPVAAGQPLRLEELMRPPLVQRGAIVRMELADGELALSAQATALDDGARGERIRVQNTSSRAFLYADVIGPGRVRVAPGSPPSAVMPVKLERWRTRP